MSLVPFITASGTDNYVSEVTQDNYLDAFNQFAQFETIVGVAGTEGGTTTSAGSGGSIVKSSTALQTVLKSVLASSPLTLTQAANELQLGIDLSDIGTVQDVTAGAGILITGTSTVNPTISNDGVITIVPHPDGSIVVDDTDPQNPILQAVVVGSGGGTVTNVSSADTSVLTVANPTTTPALTFTGVKRLIQGTGITLSPTIGTTSDARGDVTISTAASGGTVTSVSSANGDIVVSQATPAPVLTFEGVSSITGSGGVTVTSSKVGGRGNVTITATGGGGGGGGTVTSVSSTDTSILTVANPTTTPALTYSGVRRLVQGTDILLTPTLGSTSDARGNVTVTAGPNLVRTSTLTNYATVAALNSTYPYITTFSNIKNGSGDSTLYRFTNTNWHLVRFSTGYDPSPAWTSATRDWTIPPSQPLYNPFQDFTVTGAGGLGLNASRYLTANRPGNYFVTYTMVFRNFDNDCQFTTAFFKTVDNGVTYNAVANSATNFRNTDLEELSVSHSFVGFFSGLSSYYCLAVKTSNAGGGSPSSNDTMLGSFTTIPTSATVGPSTIVSPPCVRASISFVYLSPQNW